MTRIIALSNQKGGVGKTTTTYHLARAAQQRGLRVLTVDIDPQGSLTSSLSKEQLAPNSIDLADVLSARTSETLEEVIIPSIWPNVDLVPTTGEFLSVVRDELIATRLGREFKLKKALATVEHVYDLVLIDCPPSIDQLTINAMAAADAVLIVTHAAYYSLNGIAYLIDNVDDLKKLYNSELKIAGIIVNQYERNMNAPQARKLELNEAMENYGIAVLEPAIPKRTLIAESAENGQALDTVPGEDARQLVSTYKGYLSKLMAEV